MFSSEIILPPSVKYEHETINLDLSTPFQNLISLDKSDFIISYLNNKVSGNKGGNSIILTLTPAQDFEDGDVPTLVLKICKYPFRRRITKSIHKRFSREVAALYECKRMNFSNVVEIYHSGTLISEGKRLLFYTMEYCESDIKTFFESNQIPLFDRIDLCLSLAYGIEELHSLKYYHRDIKPDNIFVYENTFKIGDLGLISFRNDDLIADENGKMIGPRGWISPEAMNKYLTENLKSDLKYDCNIDCQSDIFQLGMVFWYIIQGNAPVGSIREKDFKRNRSLMYPLLRTMLNHNKQKRPINIEAVISQLKRIYNKQLSIKE